MNRSTVDTVIACVVILLVVGGVGAIFVFWYVSLPVAALLAFGYYKLWKHYAPARERQRQRGERR